MATIISTGQITLVDLIDTATYIYYAEDENGTGAKAAPDANSKYIGIYSGPPFEGFPSKFPMDNWKEEEWSGWTSYVGPQGETGNGIDHIEYRYYITTEKLETHPDANSDKWVPTMPTISAGQYLWIEEKIIYTGGVDPLINYRSSYSGTDGNDGIVYNIKTDYSQISNFYSTTNKSTVFIPNTLSYSVIKTQGDRTITLTDNTFTPIFDFNFINSLEPDEETISYKDVTSTYSTNSDFVNCFSSSKIKFGDLLNLDIEPKDNQANEIIQFLENLRQLEGELIIRLKINNVEILPSDRAISIAYGNTKDGAQLIASATKISQVIGNTSIEAHSDGLTITNGNFYIQKSEESYPLLEFDKNVDQYIKVASKELFDPEITYYIYENGGYVEQTNLTEFVEGKTYYKFYQGQLTVRGSGIFSGTIYATDGEFTGRVVATEGKFTGSINSDSGMIGGFKIENGNLFSTENEEDPSIQLDGSTGNIIAKNITLGTGAIIKKYLQLGKAYIYNPNSNNGSFISIQDEAGKEIVSLKENGVLTLGTLNFNGATSTLKGRNWNITPEVASFGQINVTKGIFKTGTIQSLGGAMLFKPVAKCVIDENNNITSLDEETDINKFFIKEGSWVILTQLSTNTSTNKPLEIISVKDEQGKIISYKIKDEDNNYKNYDLLTYYCTTLKDEQGNTTIQDNILIGVNSSSDKIGDLQKCSISFTDILLNENGISIAGSPSLLLGNLESVGYSGYGLYGDNVYLNGTLTTKVSEDSYAGVNTKDGVLASKFEEHKIILPNGEYDKSKIVFWGGAKSNSTNDIKKASFQVTEKGSIYASQGVFEGTLITKSIIEGSEIRAAKLYGWQIIDENGKLIRKAAPLSIYNTYHIDSNKDSISDLGINFREEYKEENGEIKDYKTLSLSTLGFSAYSKDERFQNNFISFELTETSAIVNANLNKITFNILDNNILKINDKKIGIYSITEGVESYGSFISFDNNEGKLGIGSNSSLSYTNELVTSHQKFSALANVEFGSSQGKMEYQQQKINNIIYGYDLYIS